MPPRAFRFRFAALLKHRERVLDKLTLELAGKQRKVIEREAARRELQEIHEDCVGALAKLVAGTINPERVIMYHNYMELIGTNMERVKQQIASLRERISEKTEEVVAASKNKKIVEKIRERDLLAFNHEIAELERKILDEVAAHQSFARTETRAITLERTLIAVDEGQSA